MISYEQAKGELLVAREGEHAEYWAVLDRSLIDFLAGVHASSDVNIDLYYQHMVACASVTEHTLPTAEMIIAECEIRNGPAKWKRQFAKWLRENDFGGQKPRKRRTKGRKA